MQRAPVFAFTSAREAVAVQENGWTSAWEDIRREGRTPNHRQRAGWSTSTPIWVRQVRLPAVQLPHRRRRRPEHGRPGHLCGLLLDILRALPGPHRPGSSWNPTWGRTRRGLLHEPPAHPGQAGHGRSAWLRRDVLLEVGHVEAESLAYHWGVASVGSLDQRRRQQQRRPQPERIRRMFHRHRAGRGEPRRGIRSAELTPNRDLYISLTLPSLIVATTAAAPTCPRSGSA